MNTRTIRFLFGTVIGLAIALLLLVLPMPVTSAPLVAHNEILVTTTTDEYDTSGTGTGCSLREAIKTANDNSDFGSCARVLIPGSAPTTILLPSNTYTLTIPGSSEDLDATGDLDIRTSVIISATGVVTPTVDALNPNGQSLNDRVIDVVMGNVTIKHVLIMHGWGAVEGAGVLIESGASLILNDSEVSYNGSFSPYIGWGGGIFNYGTLTLTNVTVHGNHAKEGGGIENMAGTMVLTGVSLEGNAAGDFYGGGIENYGTGTIMLTNVSLSGNYAKEGGGGIFNFFEGGIITLTNVSLSNNSGVGGAGGIYNGSTMMLNNVTLNNNSATLGGGSGSGIGGGIDNDGGLLTMTNVTISGNTAPTWGGGIYNSGSMALTNVTLYGNSAAGEGGISNQGGTVTLTNTMVAHSTGGNCGGTFGGNHNLSDDNNCGFNANSGQDNANVKLLPLGNYGGPTLTHVPYGGPAINFGTNTGCPPTDQRGKPRPVNGTCDVGAVERQLVDYPFLYLPLILK